MKKTFTVIYFKLNKYTDFVTRFLSNMCRLNLRPITIPQIKLYLCVRCISGIEKPSYEDNSGMRLQNVLKIT